MRHRRAILSILAAMVAVGGGALFGSEKSVAVGKVAYNRDVRGILSDNCFACHGPDKNKRKAKLRLDERESALHGGKSGDPAVVPGKPDKSVLIERIFSSDPDEQMPPADSHKTLTTVQKEILRNWIAQGAEYEPHWSYIPPKRPVVPSVKEASWVRNPIDAFILQQLEAKNIKPSKEADKRTLLRRLSLDLIGLPPTPAEVAAFLADDRPEAYENQVDRLLASPHYGERMAVPWLDAVRFADTVGFHGDQNQNVFPYRDYVINAFNNDKPFDQYTIEQIAGDLLPNPTTEQRVATCFNRLNMMTREGGAQAKEYLAKYAADRVRTLGVAFLGSTLACCECHDHKFDPFTTKDFYSLAAFWDDVKQWGIYMNYTYTPNPELKGFTNDSPFPPEIVVDSPYLHAKLNQLTKQRKARLAKVLTDVARLPEFEKWKADSLAWLKENPGGWITPNAEAKSTISVDPRKAIEFLDKPGSKDVVELQLAPGRIASISLEALATEKNKESVMRGKREESIVTVTFSLKRGGKEMNLGVNYADADHKDAIYTNGYEWVGVQNGWKTSVAHDKTGQRAVYLLETPFAAEPGDRLVVTLSNNTLAGARVSISPFAPDVLHVADEPLSSMASRMLQSDPAQLYLDSVTPDGEVRRLGRQMLDLRGGTSPVLTTISVQNQKITRVLPRGNWTDDSGPIVQPATPAFLTKNVPQRRLTRLDLAKWLVSPENPLVSRVFVNRLWKQYFGAGICSTVDDVGAQGDSPSHPELLDWLAVEFRESGWDVKHMVRLIVTSSTYRQDSNLRPELKDLDPGNRLLASQNPRRLEAEFVRDNALAAAGLINLDIGGPSAKPYQPAGYYANIQFPVRDYVADTDERQYRRGLYTHWQRTFLHPMLANFDAPSREDAVCTRNVSNTPQQALTLLNDPTFVEAARVLASKLNGDDGAKVEQIYERVLDRPVKEKEKKSLQMFLADQRKYYDAHVGDAEKLLKVGLAKASAESPGELAAWTTVCRVVLNLHETITRY